MSSAYSVRAPATESPTPPAAWQVRVGSAVAAVVLAEAQQLDVDRVFAPGDICLFRVNASFAWFTGAVGNR